MQCIVGFSPSNAIVLDGIRAPFGMQAYGVKEGESSDDEAGATFGASTGITAEDAQAIRAYVLEQAWIAYEKQQTAKN